MSGPKNLRRVDFDRLWVWQDTALSDALRWYRDVAVNRMPAKYLIARRIPVSLPHDEPALWTELERATRAFLDLWDSIRFKRNALPETPTSPNLLDLCVALSKHMLAHCNFCRWNCRVDRTDDAARRGTCQLAHDSRVGTFFHHTGEELIYRGGRGSGTIFFTSCNMRCAFCQNGDISTDKDNGIAVTPRQLALMARQLRLEGCHNANFVGGEVTIHLHTIVEAISLLNDEDPVKIADEARVALARADGYFPYLEKSEQARYNKEFNVPILWNSNFFMSDEAMRILRVLVDVWLPDFKFGPARCAIGLSRTPWYWDTVTRNLSLIGAWGEDFTIRHLVMPGHVTCCTVPVLDWIAENIPRAPVNVMDQYHPDMACDPRNPRYDPKHASMSRRATREEFDAACRAARDRGLVFETVTFEKAARR